MGNGGDILEELTADHRGVEVQFSRISGLPLGDDERKEIIDKVTTALVRHSVVEETHLYPVVRRVLPDGDAIVREELADHAGVEDLLWQLSRLSATSAGFDRLGARLAEQVTGHAHAEEAQLFPALRGTVEADELESLGAMARDTKERARTRPRPHLGAAPPDRLPPPELGVMDRVRDRLHGPSTGR
ncbi:hemerythrin domain-containing protein [Kitasatospora sp. HPMI-4]|uniref:hemerythrin domain-containing protein n=1 Tax=Kitasatospora sp. HPMI-4 TaxID=3448443 RepID=UPI003F1D3B13